MERGNRGGPVLQTCRLTGHIDAKAQLVGGADLDEPRCSRVSRAGRVAVYALGGDTRAADVEMFKPVAQIGPSQAFGLQAGLFGAEFGHDRAVDHPSHVPGTGFQQHRVLRLQQKILIGLLDRPRRHRLGGEEIPCAHQHADLCPARHDPRRHRRHHRRRQGVMNAPGEQHLDIHRRARGVAVEQYVNGLLPQHERRARADMPATFVAFKDEAPRAAFQEQLQQARRRYMQPGLDPGPLQRQRLIRSPTRDQGRTGAMVKDHLRLLGAQIVVDKAQNPDTPRPVAEQRLGLGHQRARLGPAHQRQGQKRQRATFCHSERKFRAV